MQKRGFQANEDLHAILEWVLENGNEKNIRPVLLALQSISLQTGLANPFADVIAAEHQKKEA